MEGAADITGKGIEGRGKFDRKMEDGMDKVDRARKWQENGQGKEREWAGKKREWAR